MAELAQRLPGAQVASPAPAVVTDGLARVITSVTGEAERQFGSRHVTEQSIRVALDLDGDMGGFLDEFLARVMTPAADAQD